MASPLPITLRLYRTLSAAAVPLTSALLKRRLKWTSQKPQRKAKERDEAAIAH